MNNTIIKVENLSKRYRIGTRERGYKTFREAVIDSFTAPIRNFKRLRKLSHFDDTPLPDNKELITNNLPHEIFTPLNSKTVQLGHGSDSRAHFIGADN